MFIVKNGAEVAFFGNTQRDGVDWPAVAPGSLVVQLPVEDYRAAFDWKNAGSYTEGAGANLIPDDEGREPEDPGYVETLSDPVPSAWQESGNIVFPKPNGVVDLKTAEGTIVRTLAGTVIQAP